MKRTPATIISFLGAAIVLLSVVDVYGQSRRPARRRSEVIAWSANGSIVVFAESRPNARQRLDLVARRVPNGEIVARTGVYPGQCARVIERRVAISHACALTSLRPELPPSLRGLQYHIAAVERSRITNITLRADGSVLEHELPTLGLVIRGRTEAADDDRTVAVLEVTRIDRSGRRRTLDRRPVRPRARRRWTLLQAGDNHFIVVGRRVLRRISRRRPPPDETGTPRSDLARNRPGNG